MIKGKSLEDIIREHIPLGRESGGGWYSVRCHVCNDHTARAGFRFDGEGVAFNDFNCGAKFKFKHGGRLSGSAKSILESFGIPKSQFHELTSSFFLNKCEEEEITFEALTKPKLFTPEVALPPGAIPLLSSEHEDAQEPLLNYLLSRNIDPTKTPFFFSLNEKMINRVIIPYYKNDKVIYWQARHIDPKVKPRYISCTASNSAVVYGIDRLYDYDTAPLFVTEGVFNAIMLNGIALLSSSMNATKIELLKQSKRRLIFVRDRDANGDKLTKIAAENGWEVTTVDHRINDVNDSVRRFGLAYTAFSLMKNIQKPENKIASSINMNIWGLEDRLKKLGGR